MKQHESGLKRIGERKPPLCSVVVVDCIISRNWVTSAGKEVLTMPDTLEPCPFCGGEAEVNYSCLYETGYFVSCTMCEVRTKKYSSREKAEKAWNRRAKENGHA